MSEHNPDQLTPEQYGKAEGWRLLEEDEVCLSDSVSPRICFEIQAFSTMWDNGGNWGAVKSITYRTKASKPELRKARGLEPEEHKDTVQQNFEAGKAEHNPDQLTPEQYGKAEGWRLLEEDEREAVKTECVEAWFEYNTPKWRRGPEVSWPFMTYRTKLSSAELRKARGLEPETLSQDARSTGHANQLSERALNDGGGSSETLVRSDAVGVHAGAPIKSSADTQTEVAGVTPRPVIIPPASVEEIAREAELMIEDSVVVKEVALAWEKSAMEIILSAIHRATAEQDAEIQRLRTALEPFARFITGMEDMLPDMTPMTIGSHMGSRSVPAKAFKKAASALCHE